MSGPQPDARADAATACALLAAAGLPGVTPNLVRQWAHRGKVRRLGRDPAGLTLYATADLWREATRMHNAVGV